MKIDGEDYRSIWLNQDGWSIDIIDQTRLPHRFEIRNLRTLDDACIAIQDMQVRGAPLIGTTAAFGVSLEMRRDPCEDGFKHACQRLLETRPTAVNLRWALDRLGHELSALPEDARAAKALSMALEIADLDVITNHKIGEHGLALIRSIAANKSGDDPVNILTHCNAGWLATVDWGTATAPIYMAHQAGINIHVWVDETRPRNQGAALTAWELGHEGVPHSLIVDNAGGHLMQHGMVDLCLVGSDRTSRNGDVCNKIGTYLKALAAADNKVPFHVCLPASTIDWSIRDGVSEIPIEHRDAHEVCWVRGESIDGELTEVSISPPHTTAVNYAFDVTPAHLISGLITEKGIIAANSNALDAAFGKNRE